MSANTTLFTSSKARFYVAALVVLATAFTAWGVLSQRAPDPALLPAMAQQSVVLPDGHVIYVQRNEVTVAEWNECHAQGDCTLLLHTPAWLDPATTPATGLSYVDVQEYVTWISAATGHGFRLPTSDEWEFMAAAVLPDKPDPLFTDPSLTWASTYLIEGTAPRALKPQDSFSTSPEGIADLDGSVWEWTADCYAGAGENVDPDRCPAFYVGGEHLAVIPYLVRDPARGGCAVGTPPAHLGMRLVSDEAVLARE